MVSIHRPSWGPNLRGFKPDVKVNSSPLRRVQGRAGKNVDNYLQGEEIDEDFEAAVTIQVVDDNMSDFLDNGFSFPVLLDKISGEVKALSFQIVLTYENALGESMSPIRIATVTSAIDHPNHMLRAYESAPETTEFGTKVIVHPETFEEVFKTPNVSWHGGIGKSIAPPTNFGFFSVDSTDLEELRDNDSSKEE